MIAIFMRASGKDYRSRYFKPKISAGKSEFGGLGSISLEYRLRFVGEGYEGTFEIGRSHAECLRHRLRLDRLLDRHRPFHRQHALGHGVGEARTFGHLSRKQLRLRQHWLGRDDAAEEAPALALLRGHETTGIKQF